MEGEIRAVSFSLAIAIHHTLMTVHMYIHAHAIADRALLACGPGFSHYIYALKVLG